MEPITRKEVFLDALCDGEGCSLEPVTREEVMLKRLTESVGGSGGSGGRTLYFVHSAQEGNGIPFLYHTSEDAESGEESKRVTANEFAAAIASGVIVIKDNELGWYWTPSWCRAEVEYGQAQINDTVSCYTAEYADREG